MRTAFMLWGLVLVTILLVPSGPALAERDVDLTDLSIEDLLEMEVTSVSKRAQKLSRTAAAVTVVTSEDIRRSGMTSIPEILRMVPGLHVANIDAGTWAITSRGFNSQFANKLLVMIDGRSVYTPLFSGTYWDIQDLMLEDIDRIEVIRGPGGTVWGANAVNGVINIITKSSEETQGLLVSSDGGNQEYGTQGRFGGAIGDDAFYRVYVKYRDHDDFDDGPIGNADDDGNAIRGGLRFDWNVTGKDLITLQGDYYDANESGLSLDTSVDESDLSGGNILARWTHSISETSDASLQVYYDRTERFGALLGENRDTVDVEFRHHFQPLARNEMVWGAGYRMTADDITSSPSVSFTPEDRTDHLFSVFVQNEISVIPGLLSLTIGSKFEHNDYTGFEFQPSGRALFTPHERHTFWAAVSRAVRAPSRAEDDVSLMVPLAPTAFNLLSGNRDFESEDLLAYEAGYRAMPFEDVSLDIAGYYNVYDGLRSTEPGLPIINFPFLGATTFPVSGDNKYDAATYGVEVSATWDPTDFLRLTTGYTFMKVDMDQDTDSLDSVSRAQEDDTPTSQVFVLSRIDLPFDFELDTSLYWVGEVKNQGVGDYVRLDTRIGWHPTEQLELSLVGQNLTQRRHQEFGPSFTRLPSQVPRAVYGKVTWRR